MKQAFQDARSAAITVVEVPAPKLLAGCVLVRTAASLVSAGTERAASEFAAKNLLQKAQNASGSGSRSAEQDQPRWIRSDNIRCAQPS